MSELSNFQKNFLAGSGHVEVFTQKEFDEALTLAKAEIMTVAIETTKQAIYIEREACADIVKEAGHAELAEKLLNRIPVQRQ
jgi:hypothetical protein